MSYNGTNFVKRIVYFTRKYRKKAAANLNLAVQYFGFFVVGAGSVLYLCQKNCLVPTLLASEEQKRKRIVVLGTGWAAVNFLR